MDARDSIINAVFNMRQTVLCIKRSGSLPLISLMLKLQIHVAPADGRIWIFTGTLL
jgi:hypothetical protein